MIRRTALHLDHFTQAPNDWLRDQRLSRRARGLLCELLSHKPGWQVSIDSLVASGPEGRDAIRSAIAELEQHGYLVREKQRSEGGRLAGVDYRLVDPWITSVGKTDDGSPDVGESATKNTKSLEDYVEEDKGTAKAVRPHVIPADFEVSTYMYDWAKLECPLVDVGSELPAFIDYFTESQKKYKNWELTWKNWMRRQQKWAAERQGKREKQPLVGAVNMAQTVDPYNGWD